MRKKITVVSYGKTKDGLREYEIGDFPDRLRKEFSTFASIARAMKDGEIADVCVITSTKGKFWQLAGYGEVHRVNCNKYLYPARLLPDY